MIKLKISAINFTYVIFCMLFFMLCLNEIPNPTRREPKTWGRNSTMGGGGLLYCSFSLRGKDYYIAGFPGEKATMGGGTAIQHRYNDFISLNLHFSRSRYISIMRKTITTIWNFQIFLFPGRCLIYIMSIYLKIEKKTKQYCTVSRLKGKICYKTDLNK